MCQHDFFCAVFWRLIARRLACQPLRRNRDSSAAPQDKRRLRLYRRPPASMFCRGRGRAPTWRAASPFHAGGPTRAVHSQPRAARTSPKKISEFIVWRRIECREAAPAEDQDASQPLEVSAPAPATPRRPRCCRRRAPPQRFHGSFTPATPTPAADGSPPVACHALLSAYDHRYASLMLFRRRQRVPRRFGLILTIERGRR